MSEYLGSVIFCSMFPGLMGGFKLFLKTHTLIIVRISFMPPAPLKVYFYAGECLTSWSLRYRIYLGGKRQMTGTV